MIDSWLATTSAFLWHRAGSGTSIPATPWLIRNRSMKMHASVITATVPFSLWKTGMLLKGCIYCVNLCAKSFSPPSSNLALNGRFEQAFVNSLLSASGANSGRYYWIGLTSTDADGAYLWDHNTDPRAPLTYTNWNKHQPGSVPFRQK